MKQQIFKVQIEFDRNTVNFEINQQIKQRQKGYVCVCDGAVFARANRDEDYCNILNGAFINVCDGFSIAMFASLIYKKKYATYHGPELFEYFTKQNYSQVFLGNTDEVLKQLKRKFADKDYNINKMHFIPLPFNPVNGFNYSKIGNLINNYNPQIVWVSLGAPKQEMFISKLMPYIDNCLVIAIGAAFSLFIDTGYYKRAPSWIRSIGFEWLFRIFLEPKRFLRALNYIAILPKMIISEIYTR